MTAAAVDAALYARLVAEGIADTDATELAATFAGSDPDLWVEGLMMLGSVVAGIPVAPMWAKYPAPWDTLGELVAQAPAGKEGDAFTAGIAVWSQATQTALMAVYSLGYQKAAAHMPGQPVTPQRTKGAGRKTTAAAAAARKLGPIDAAFAKKLARAVSGSRMTPQKRQQAAALLIDWLVNHGRLIYTSGGQRYYLHRSSARLLELKTPAWHSWLYLLTRINPADSLFKYLEHDCEQAIRECGERLDVVRVAHWEEETGFLRVSRFDGHVYRLDGTTIEIEANGDGPVIFHDERIWEPYTPDYSGDGSILAHSLRDLAHWEGERDPAALLSMVWWLSTFFTERCPTRPLLVLKGEAGSGKSVAARIPLRYLFGPLVNLRGMPKKPADWVALVSNEHILGLDNLDDFSRDVQDDLARIATGSTFDLRELYTTNNRVSFEARCWLLITSRTPDTLRRDDLVDRAIILPVSRIADHARRTEFIFLQEVRAQRNAWWGDLLRTLNEIVRTLRAHGAANSGGLRMEDWAALGATIAATLGQSAVWLESLSLARSQQAATLLEDEIVVAVLEEWLGSPQFTPNELTTRALFSVLTALAHACGVDAGWPRSTRSFGKRLSSIRRQVEDYLAQRGWIMTVRDDYERRYYQFARAGSPAAVQVAAP